MISEKKDLGEEKKILKKDKFSNKKKISKKKYEKSKEKKFCYNKKIKNFLKKKENLMIDKFTLNKFSRQSSLKKIKKNETSFDRNTLKSSRSRIIGGKIKFQNLTKNSREKKKKRKKKKYFF